MLSTSKFSSAAAPAAVGASLRSPMRLTGCCCRSSGGKSTATAAGAQLFGQQQQRRQIHRHGRRRSLLEHRINNTAAQQKSCFFGVGLRCARHVCSAAARRSPWEESRRAFGLPGFRAFRASGLPGCSMPLCALAPGHPEPAASAAAASVLFPVRFPARIRPASPSASSEGHHTRPPSPHHTPTTGHLGRSRLFRPHRPAIWLS